MNYITRDMILKSNIKDYEHINLTQYILMVLPKWYHYV